MYTLIILMSGLTTLPTIDFSSLDNCNTAIKELQSIEMNRAKYLCVKK